MNAYYDMDTIKVDTSNHMVDERVEKQRKRQMYRKHGNKPVLVLHGGPGAIGDARSMAHKLGAIEMLSYGQTIEAQINEVEEVIRELSIEKPIIIGYSWGAWLAYMYASSHSVKKVILVGCGAFEEKYLGKMQSSRLSRLTNEEQKRAECYFEDLNSGRELDLSDFNYLMSKMDSVEMIGHDVLDQFDYVGHQKLMREIRPLRRSGELLEMGRQIESEIIVIHGLEDPHPVEGVTEPFDTANIPYQLYTLDKCGHTPWHEKHAKERFYQIIEQNI